MYDGDGRGEAYRNRPAHRPGGPPCARRNPTYEFCSHVGFCRRIDRPSPLIGRGAGHTLGATRPRRPAACRAARVASDPAGALGHECRPGRHARPRRSPWSRRRGRVQPAPPGLAPDPGARPLRGGPLRGHRRPDPPQARPGAVSTSTRAGTCRRGRHRRLRPARLVRRPVPRRAQEALANAKDPGFEAVLGRLRPRISYNASNFDDPAGYRSSRHAGAARRHPRDQGNRLFYLAVSPEYFSVIVEQLGQAGLIYAATTRAAPGAGWSSRSRSATTSPAPAT